MNFFKKIKSSIFDKTFYQNIKNETVSSAVFYTLSFVFLSSIILVGFLSIRIIPALHQFKAFVASTDQYYPEGLVITIKDNMVSTNVTEPYLIKTKPTDGTEPRTVVVIDTKNPFTPEAFKAQKASFYVTKDSIVTVGQRNNEMTITKIENMIATTTINKANVTKATEYIASKMGLLTPISITILLIVFWIVFTLITLLLSLLGAVIVWIMDIKVFKTESNFDNSYKKALYLSTLPSIIALIATLIMVRLPALMYVLVFVLLAYINLAPNTDHKTHSQK